MTVSDAMISGHDIAHGGYVFMLADTAFAFACNTYGRPRRPRRATSSSSGRPVELIAVAIERARYGRSGIYDVTVRAGAEVVAEFRGRSRTLPEEVWD